MPRIRLFLLSQLILGAVVPGTAQADTTFSVANNLATAYVVTGFSGNNPTLTLTKGQSYHFQVNAPGHPFFISTTANSAAGPHFTTGVINENVTIGTLDFIVPATAPATLFYQCGIHNAMSGQLTIVAPAVPAAGSAALVALAALVLLGGAVSLHRRARA